MTTGLVVFLLVSVLLNVILVFVCVRAARRLLQFDELFQLLLDDIDVNVKFFEKLLSTPLFENSNEVRNANKNMSVISKRLSEFALRINETTNSSIKK